MEHFYITVNLDKEYVQETQVFTKACLEAEGAEYPLHHTPERTKGGARIDGAQIPGDTECVITIGGDGTLIQTARDLTGRNIPVLGVSQGHLGYLNQVSRQEDIAPVLGSLLNEHYQLERRTMVHGTVWREEKTLLKDITLDGVAITRRDPLKMLRHSVYVNDEYLNEYAADGVLIAMPTGSTACNLSVGGPVIAPGARMMVLTPIYSHSLNARGIVLTPEDRVRTKILNNGQVIFFDGGMSVELKAGDCIDTRCSELQTVIMKLEQISSMQNLGNHLRGL